MARAIDQWALTAGLLIFVCAAVACKKRDDPAPAASVSASAEQAAAAVSAAVAQAAAAASAAQAAAVTAASASVAPVASVAPSAAALGEVKRFRDTEKTASGTTKVSLAESKIYNEPDASTPSVTSLPKDLLVTRLATLGTDWVLIEFPAGVGKVAPGWIEAQSLVAPSAVGAKPATSASAASLASSKPATAAVASATPAPSAPVVRAKPGTMRAPRR